MESNPVCGNCWVAYFDILGFRGMLGDFRRRFPDRLDLFVKNHYWDVLKALKRETAYCIEAVSIAWFSDSLLLFSRSDDLKSFACTLSAAGGFFYEVVCQMMPLRGALAFGDFYADTKNTVFLGQALIDAHDYAEDQDWIGLVVTPGAYEKQREFDERYLLTDRGFVEHEVFFTERSERQPERLFAYRPDPDLRGHMLGQVAQVQSAAKHEHPDEYDAYKRKYERTIAFLES